MRVLPPLRPCLGVLLLSLIACARTGTTPPAAPADPWPEFSRRFIEESFRADPFFAVQAGRHEFDGQMPDWSASALAAEVARLKRARAEAGGFSEAALTPQERFERLYLSSVIEGDLFWRERARSPFTNPAWYIDQLDPDVYLNRPYAPLAQRLRGYLGYARAIPRISAQIRANLQTPLPASFVKLGIDSFGGFAEFFRHEVAPQFAAVQDPTAQQELARVDAEAAQAMDELKSWLAGERAHAGEGFALGTPRLLEMLKATERVEVPLAQLLAIGRADLQRNTEALRQACARYLPHRPLKACVDRMASHKAQGGVLAGARAQLEQLRSFIIAHHIVSVPSEQQALVAEAPPYNRSNGAYINVPGPYEQNVPAIYNIAPPDPSWTLKERQQYIPGRANLLYTSVHEVWPGHFLQFLHANRNPSKLEALWVGYAFAEGWAHYAEELMWEAGLGEGDPEQHVGQLVNALLRNVRYLSAIGLHTGTLSVAESERMFRERAFADAGTARQQAERGTYDPEYLKYTLGKLMIRKLREDWVVHQAGAQASTDPRVYWHDFHDQFLAHGGPPIPLLRQLLLGADGTLF